MNKGSARLQFLRHIRSASLLESFFQIGVDWTQLHAGVSYPILEKTQPSLPHLEAGWCTSMHDSLGNIDASIHLPTSVLPRALRQHDCILMDDLIYSIFTPSQVKKINLCRLYLQVECLAKICNPTGTCILDAVWRGTRPLSHSLFLWPRQTRPHSASWQLWRRFIHLVYLHSSKQRSMVRSSDLRLAQRLGPWLGNRHLEIRRWRTYVSTDGDTLYHYRHDILYQSVRITSCTRHNNRFHCAAVTIPTLPHTVIPASVHLAAHYAIISPTPYPQTLLESLAPIPRLPLPTFFAMLERLPSWQSTLLEHLDNFQMIDKQKELLESGETLKLYLDSDGGAKEDLGSFGWELAIGRQLLWHCKGPTFGLNPGSFRAESYGMLSAIIFLEFYI
jgi:hypothetical protein